jgi:hypothetical protein
MDCVMTLEELVDRIKWLIRLDDGFWAATAVGGSGLIKGSTAIDAMTKAIRAVGAEPQLPDPPAVVDEMPNADLF